MCVLNSLLGEMWRGPDDYWDAPDDYDERPLFFGLCWLALLTFAQAAAATSILPFWGTRRERRDPSACSLTFFFTAFFDGRLCCDYWCL